MANNFSTYSIGGAVIQATQFTLAENMAHNPNTNVVRLMGMAEVEPNSAFTASVDPVINLEFLEIEKLLDLVTSGNEFAVDLSSVASLYLVKNARVERAAAGSHHLMTVNDGILAVDRLTWSGINDPWRAAARIVTNYNGTNDPVVLSDTGTLPSPFIIPQEVFLGGKLLINGTELLSLQSMTIEFGWNVEQLRGGGTAFPTCTEAKYRTPVITGQVLVAANSTLIGIAGLRITSAAIYMRQVDQTTLTTRIADAGLSHIRLDIDSGLISFSDVTSTTADQNVVINFSLVTSKIAPGTDGIIYTKDVAIP